MFNIIIIFIWSEQMSSTGPNNLTSYYLKVYLKDTALTPFQSMFILMCLHANAVIILF